jgi:hypothetical protein
VPDFKANSINHAIGFFVEFCYYHHTNQYCFLILADWKGKRSALLHADPLSYMAAPCYEVSNHFLMPHIPLYHSR